ncbi:MAG: hypothetical protein L0027_15265, partial [Candidatus Rokubacteria bacterium]|nr:hypothetical protein [Candidatus Rokubacteria bacterium]
RASLLRGREEWDYPPHHLTRWSEKAVGIALEAAGYRPIGVGFPPPTPGDFTGSGMGRLLGGGHHKPITPAGPAAAARRSPASELSRIAAVWLGRAVLFSPLILLRRLQGYSTTSMVVMARPAESVIYHEAT